jgi:predicted methyltransferase
MDDNQDNPTIEYIQTPAGETSLLIEGGQAMQGWETNLMWESADLLCRFGSEFLEVGLGLGISALRIASNPATRQHTVVEKYTRVIEIFAEHNAAPANLRIVHGDFLDYIEQLDPASVDGVFFDPYLPQSQWDDPALWNRVMPLFSRALRTGGVFIPCFATRPVLKWQYVPFFERIIVERHSFTIYDSTNYAPQQSGDAFIQCFVKTS